MGGWGGQPAAAARSRSGRLHCPALHAALHTSPYADPGHYGAAGELVWVAVWLHLSRTLNPAFLT